MLDQLEKLDISVIDDLLTIKKEREVLADRLSRLDGERENVSAAVYERVREDYTSQTSALEEQAAPLKERAREGYSELQALLESTQRALDSAQLKKEELELRHRLGEFDQGEFKSRLTEIETLLDGHQQDLAEISDVRHRFISAFDSESELNAPAEPPPTESKPAANVMPQETKSPEAVESRESVTAALDSVPGETVLVPQELPERADEAGAESATVSTEAKTVLMPQETTSPRGEADERRQAEDDYDTVRAPPAPSSTRTRDDGITDVLSGSIYAQPGAQPGAVGSGEGVSPSVTDGGGTTVLPAARLEADEPIAGESLFVVEPLTLVGRTPESQIRIDERAVSREHAHISLTPAGFLVRDLGSENGTYINGERVEEWLLSDGDRVAFGTVRFTFRM